MNVIGINVREVDGVGAPAIIAAPTSVAAFNILTQRGVPNHATAVDSFPASSSSSAASFPMVSAPIW